MTRPTTGPPPRRLLRTLALLAAATVAVVGCGGDGDDASGDDATDDRVPTATTRTEAAGSGTDAGAGTSTGTETGETAPTPTPAPAPVAPGEAPPITVTTPVEFADVPRTAPLALTGSATATGGALAWAVLGADLQPLVQGRVQASCSAPCRGAFRVRVPTADLPLGSFELHVWEPGRGAGGEQRVHDTLVPITVVERATPGAPPADAFPPGGVPQQG